MDQENFVEWDQSPFSERAKKAALQGNLDCALPLVSTLEDAKAAFRGLEQICKIANANRVQEFAWRDKDDDDESIQPPMGINTVESLLALGEVVSRMFVSDIDRVSDWMDKHAIREPDPVADLAIAAQAAVAQARRRRVTAPEVEGETA